MSSALKNALVNLKKFHNTYYTGRYCNRGRHVLLKSEGKNSPIYYLLFKRDFFLSFSDQFKDFTSRYKAFAGYGESINSELLEYSINSGVDRLLFTYPSGACYYTYPNMIKRFCEKNNLVRIQDGGELTYSFPLRILNRLNKEDYKSGL